MTSYFNACDVTVANSNHKICYNFFLTPPALKKVPPPMARYKTELEKYSLLSTWSTGKCLDSCQFESLLYCIMMYLHNIACLNQFF